MEQAVDLKKNTGFVWLIALGIALRFLVMTFGHNYDFESYCIVGKLADNFKNVYAETDRYNYGPVFFIIQGILYRLSALLSVNVENTYRVLMVAFLTAADLGITQYIAYHYSFKKAVIFFLNPVSVIITGYHNQFDNIAMLLALVMLIFYNEEDNIGKKDVIFVLLFALCLMTKHILFAFPIFLLFKKSLVWKKKMFYVFTPVLLFLLSFLPFALGNPEAFNGIMKNVFFYRSFNNAPLLNFIYRMIGFPDEGKFIVYIGMMFVAAFLVRKENIERILLFYLVTMVAFASSIANQYLVIPVVALCVFDDSFLRNLYFIMIGLFLILQKQGLGALEKLRGDIPKLAGTLMEIFVGLGYILAAWLLLIVFIREITKKDPVEKAN